MITITNIRDIEFEKYDAVWAIVRSSKRLNFNNQKFRHVPILSPSWDLFKYFIQLRNNNSWDVSTFQNNYVPLFLNEMCGQAQQRKLHELCFLDSIGKSIALVCFCQDEELCHRSIIAGILQSKGVLVNGVKKDYRFYIKEI